VANTQHRRQGRRRKRGWRLPSLNIVVARIKALAPEREIYLRSGGKVRFLRISSHVQLAFAALVLVVFGSWGAVTGAMLWSQAQMGAQQAALAAQRAAVTGREADMRAYRRSVDQIAEDIQARQRALEAMMRSSLGIAPADVAPAAEGAGKRMAPKRAGTVGAVSPEGRFEALQAKQHALEGRLADAARARLEKVERAIRGFGLNPSAFARGGQARGGPFEPVTGLIAHDAGLRTLAALLGRLEAMETTLATIPSGRPTASPMQSSSYGYRRDPFNGLFAFHAGIDFPGRYGQDIRAASEGRVRFVGRRPGYGNVIEIDHGNAIMTRYAHLSRFGAKVGDRVTRGQTIARMGSTGRSTGTHLHFEVRVRGAAVNPRRFLEARQDVLEVQKLIKQRLDGSDRG
jgi:murein DD-endopeptidase MepM/ murein hydrolase activator NlpD